MMCCDFGSLAQQCYLYIAVQSSKNDVSEKVGTMGVLYKGKIMKKWGRASRDRILSRGLKIASLLLKIGHYYPLAPPIPWKLETFPFFLLIFIIRGHL